MIIKIEIKAKIGGENLFYLSLYTFREDAEIKEIFRKNLGKSLFSIDIFIITIKIFFKIYRVIFFIFGATAISLMFSD